MKTQPRTMRARLSPEHVESLKPNMVALIGHEGEWEYGFTQDVGKYAGQAVYYLGRSDPRYPETLAMWVPAEYLKAVS